jgi:PKHD-type hydroxylase|tara:strand:+ start:489 stop:1046 length:558 start_codon:yes stop_codon:yes gene_type:complete
MNTYCYSWQAELSEEHCEAIKALYFEGNTKEAEVGNVSNIDKLTRSSNILPCPYDSQNGVYLDRIMHQYITMANRECFGVHLNGFQDFQIAKYGKGDFYDYHMDSNIFDHCSQRKLSITVQLSDSIDYVGGDFEFNKDLGSLDKKKLREKGTILVFPSFLYHRVTKVTKGERFSLVGWYEGADWV